MGILRFYSHDQKWKFKQIICALLVRRERQAVLGYWAPEEGGDGKVRLVVDYITALQRGWKKCKRMEFMGIEQA